MPVGGGKGGRVLRNKTIVCLSVSLYDTPAPTAAHYLMREFARSNQVLFVERSLPWKELLALRRDGAIANRLWRKVHRNPRLRREGDLWVLTPPPVLPVGSLSHGGLYAAATRANAAVLRASILSALAAMRLPLDVLWVGNDLAAGAALAGTLGEGACVYHCFDEPEPRRSTERRTPVLERKLARRTHIIFASSPELARDKRNLGVPVVCLPAGVDHERYASALAPEVLPPWSLGALPRPVLAYAGPLGEDIDFKLLETVALCFAEGSLVLIGPSAGISRERLRILETLPNITYLASAADLPIALKAVDVGLIPLRPTAARRSSWLAKANEFLALGKPVVAVACGERSAPVRAHAAVRVAATAEGFCRAIREAAADQGPGAALARSRMAARSSWRQRATDASGVLERILERQPEATSRR